MAPRYLKPGQDFDFSKDFGFSGSAVGRHDARNHPAVQQDEFDDGLSKSTKLAGGGRVCAADGGKIKRVRKADGGAMGAPAQEPTISMPMSQATKTAQKIAQVGRAQGAAMAGRALAAPRGAPGRRPTIPVSPPTSPAAAPPQAPNIGALAQSGAIPGMAKGGKFIQKAITHKGRETRRAAESGRSVHEQMVKDSHSSDPSLRGAGTLGLRLTGGDLSHRRKKG